MPLSRALPQLSPKETRHHERSGASLIDDPRAAYNPWEPYPMTTLSKILDGLKAKAADEHGVEFSRIVEIGARIAQQDEQILQELQHLLDSHAARRAEIHQRLLTLASRIGALPPPAQHQPQPLESEPFVAPRYLNQHPADDAIDDIHRAGVLQ